MNKILSNTWAVVTIIVAVIAALTTLAVTHLIPSTDLVKILTAFLAGAAAAWQRGSALSPEESAAVAAFAKVKTADAPEEKPKTTIPPVLPLLVLALSLAFLPAATCAQAKTIVRTANDRAAELCAHYYSQKQGISVDDALKTICTSQEILAPWIKLVLSAEKSGVGKSGETACEPGPTQSTVDGGSAEVH